MVEYILIIVFCLILAYTFVGRWITLRSRRNTGQTEVRFCLLNHRFTRSDLPAAPEEGYMRLSWTAPSGALFAGIRIKIDGRRAPKIYYGESLVFILDSGHHEVKGRLQFIPSNTITVEVLHRQDTSAEFHFPSIFRSLLSRGSDSPHRIVLEVTSV